MSLSLSPEVQRLIDERVNSGRYPSAEDVVTAALANLEQQEQIATLSAAEIEVAFPGFGAKIEQGWEDLSAGRVSDGDAFFDGLDREDKDNQDSGRKSA
jgi:antitoxin ParD1/3/4